MNSYIVKNIAIIYIRIMNVYFIVMNVVDNIQIKGNDVAQTYIGDSKLISDYLIYHIQIYSVRVMIIHDLNMMLGIDSHILVLPWIMNNK
jgi:hypothetical protein